MQNAKEEVESDSKIHTVLLYVVAIGRMLYQLYVQLSIGKPNELTSVKID